VYERGLGSDALDVFPNRSGEIGSGSHYFSIIAPAGKNWQCVDTSMRDEKVEQTANFAPPPNIRV
jgi:hypothetical protein